MKKVLVICDDIWHPAEVIEAGFSLLKKKDYVFDFVKTAKDILTPEMIAEYPVIFCCKGNAINAANSEPWFEDTVTEVGPEELASYVENGGTFVVLHAGSAVDPSWVHREEKFQKPARAYQELIGCTFHGHPLRCPVCERPVNPDHPIMRGVESFTERDEHYMIKITAEDVTMLFETDSVPGGSGVPGGFLFKRGAGQVIVLTPGHTLSVWKNVNFRKILENLLGMVYNS